VDEDDEAEFYFDPIIFGDQMDININATLTVVDTDYDNYAVVAMCQRWGSAFYGSGLLVMTRNETLRNSVRNDIEDSLDEHMSDFYLEDLREIYQGEECEY